jgi:hypothetical protein
MRNSNDCNIEFSSKSVSVRMYESRNTGMKAYRRLEIPIKPLTTYYKYKVQHIFFS